MIRTTTQTNNNMTNIIEIQKEVNAQLGNKETFNALVATTFKGLEVTNVKKAIMEGMMRGFKFNDFLEKNVYAIPFRGGYSLVTSVDYARKIGMRSGVVGKSAPTFEEKEGRIISCSITIKRNVGGVIGDYTATVYFDEYSTGNNLWKSKPRTMIAKVAEMHALRMACPEELSQSYTEEEVDKEKEVPILIDVPSFKARLENSKTLDELKSAWAALPTEAKNELKGLKEQMKETLTHKTTANENA
jgi:hypothetical protein